MRGSPPFWIRVGQSPLIFTYSILVVLFGIVLGFSKNELDRTPVGHYLPAPFDHLWLAWYVVGGGLVAFSFVLADARVEACGLSVLGGALVADAIALGFEFGFVTSWRGQVFYAALYVAYFWRLVLLFHLSRRLRV